MGLTAAVMGVAVCVRRFGETVRGDGSGQHQFRVTMAPTILPQCLATHTEPRVRSRRHSARPSVVMTSRQLHARENMALQVAHPSFVWVQCEYSQRGHEV